MVLGTSSMKMQIGRYIRSQAHSIPQPCLYSKKAVTDSIRLSLFGKARDLRRLEVQHNHGWKYEESRYCVNVDQTAW